MAKELRSAVAPVAPVVAGDVLAGKYRVERVLGVGGMGVVVAARHMQLDQTVALKFMTLRSAGAEERFLREARAAAKLKSEHAAKVHDVASLEDGAPYMVMEYLEGSDLHQVLQAHGALPIEDAVGYVMQACEALGEAHALGIVHRDLKPHNLFLTTGVGGRPKVKVLDFGISKTRDGDISLTKSSDIVGTPVYMSPEQLRSSRDVDARADIWALGAMLYELVTGRVPFEAENVAHLCSMVFSESPRPPIELRADIPPALSAAILRCLSRDPAARFKGVMELVTELEPFAPPWATIDRVRWVPSMVPSGRAVITSPSGSGVSSGKTSAAWSDTELAPAARPVRWRTPATIAVGGTLAVIATMLALAWGRGGDSPTELLVGARTRSATGSPAAAAVEVPAQATAAAVAVPADVALAAPNAASPTPPLAVAALPTDSPGGADAGAHASRASSPPRAASPRKGLAVPPAHPPVAPKPPSDDDALHYR